MFLLLHASSSQQRRMARAFGHEHLDM